MSIFRDAFLDSAASAKSKLFDAMRACGVNHLEAYYSGGNDEGGVDDIEKLFDADGRKITIENLGWEHPLFEAVDNMLSMEFGSWAGDFSASGTIIADIKENRVYRTGQQSAYPDDSNEW